MAWNWNRIYTVTPANNCLIQSTALWQNQCLHYLVHRNWD
jgi:hypothetical protein